MPVPEGTPVCRGCQAELGPASRFCPACGLPRDAAPQALADRATPYDAGRDWAQIRGVLIFGGVWLASFIPLAWLPERHAANGELIIGAFDALLILFAISRLGGVDRTHFDPRRVPMAWWGWCLFALIVAIPVNLAYHASVAGIFGIDDAGRLTAPFDMAGYPLWVAMLAIVVQPAVVEELGFRGVIQHRLVAIIGRREGLIVVALAFAIIHLAWFSIPYLAALGFVLGWLRLGSGSLLPPMLLHALHNLIILLIGLR